MYKQKCKASERMTFNILIVVLVVVATFLFCCDETEALSMADVKERINAGNAKTYVGLGGKYSKLVQCVSKKDLIESDHYCPKSVYPYSSDPTVRAIDEGDMAAVSILHADHRKLLTTGNANEGAGYFNPWMGAHFERKEYYEAIKMNIQVYEEKGILTSIKKGVMDGLKIHKANNLLTDAEITDLITLYQLDQFDAAFEATPARVEAYDLIWK